MPDLVGLTLEVAQQRLVRPSGSRSTPSSYLPGRVVRSQSAAADQMVKKGTKVTLTF